MIKDKITEILKRKTTILWLCALFFTIASFMEFSTPGSMDREVLRLESVIHKRQQILEQYAVKTLSLPDNEFISFKDLPEDMIIYRYFDDTLQSWANQLPIYNDDIFFFPFGYRINHMNSRVITNTPLAYLKLVEQYVSLGSAWYIVNVIVRDNQTVVTALLVQTEYPSEE